MHQPDIDGERQSSLKNAVGGLFQQISDVTLIPIDSAVNRE